MSYVANVGDRVRLTAKAKAIRTDDMQKAFGLVNQVHGDLVYVHWDHVNPPETWAERMEWLEAAPSEVRA